jgi:hypothetical protein
MRNVIREKRKISFSYKRITPDVIRRLAAIIDYEVLLEANHESGSNCYYLYSVDATDDSSYESQAISIFDEKELIEQKVISKVNMRFNLIDNSKNIEIQLQQTNEEKNNGNLVLVSGDDSIWVNGVITRINEIISLTENQPKSEYWVRAFLIISWSLFMVMFCRLFWGPLVKINSDFAALLVGGLGILTFLGGNNLYDYIQTMYPMVELQTGVGYLQIPRNKRRILNLIVTTIVLPILLAVVYDVVKCFIVR